MSTLKYRIRLKAAHDKMGKSPYEIAAELGMSKNTVIRYVGKDEAFVDQVHISVAILAAYYDVDYHDVVDIVEMPEDPEKSTLLAATA